MWVFGLALAEYLSQGRADTMGRVTASTAVVAVQRKRWIMTWGGLSDGKHEVDRYDPTWRPLRGPRVSPNRSLVCQHLQARNVEACQVQFLTNTTTRGPHGTWVPDKRRRWKYNSTVSRGKRRGTKSKREIKEGDMEIDG